MKKFGERLRELRKSKKMSAQKIADMAGINRRAYTYWESGETEPSHAQEDLLADFFGVSWIIFEGDPMTRSHLKKGNVEITNRPQAKAETYQRRSAIRGNRTGA
jgi:transcriptional regulator with XRE-family HTH domain